MRISLNIFLLGKEICNLIEEFLALLDVREVCGIVECDPFNLGYKVKERLIRRLLNVFLGPSY